MSDPTAPATPPVAAVDLLDWLRERVAAQTGRAPAEIRDDLPLTEYGLDSVYVLGLSAEIEDHYGIEVDASLLWDNTSLAPLAQALLPLVNAAR